MAKKQDKAHPPKGYVGSKEQYRRHVRDREAYFERAEREFFLRTGLAALRGDAGHRRGP